tara:strand:+ start:6412 stop:7914 length:1503 start_codon:yes stop_codon:yes gene_type:complete
MSITQGAVAAWELINATKKYGTRSTDPQLTDPKTEILMEVDATDAQEVFEVSTSKVVAMQGRLEALHSLSIHNVGDTVLAVNILLNPWTDDTTDSGNAWIHFLMKCNESYDIPTKLIDVASANAMDGTVVSTFQDPAAVAYVATANLLNDAGGINTTDTAVTVDAGEWIRLGDFLRLEDEIVEVTAVSGNDLTIRRARHGSSAASHADNVAVRFPYHNGYLEFDNAAKIMTDSLGRYKSSNFFGLGRSTTRNASGILPGSVTLVFYGKPYQDLGLKNINSNTNSALVIGRTYSFGVNAHAAGIQNMEFTVESQKFGGPTGIIAKMQEALDEQYYTAGNLFEKRVSVGLINGDIRFTYHSRKSDATIALAAGTTGDDNTYKIFAAQNGRIHILASCKTAVAAEIPVTNMRDKNYLLQAKKGVLAWDDGHGNIRGAATGQINYETGSWDITGPKNASFQYLASHSCGMAGVPNAAKGNTIKKIMVRSLNTVINGKVLLKAER